MSRHWQIHFWRLYVPGFMAVGRGAPEHLYTLAAGRAWILFDFSFEYGNALPWERRGRRGLAVPPAGGRIPVEFIGSAGYISAILSTAVSFVCGDFCGERCPADASNVGGRAAICARDTYRAPGTNLITTDDKIGICVGCNRVNEQQESNTCTIFPGYSAPSPNWGRPYLLRTNSF